MVIMRPLATAALAAILVLSAAAPAAAEAASAQRGVDIRGTADDCDRDARGWVVTWSVTNVYDVAGTIGHVRADPPGRPVEALPQRIQPGETVTGTQRLAHGEYSARLTLDVNWDDGPVTYDHWWPIYIRAFCG